MSDLFWIAWFSFVSTAIAIGIFEQEKRIWDHYDRGGK